MARFDGKVAIVTGAASGIGRATAVRLARDGARVIVADVNDEGTAETVDMAGGNARAVHLDVTDEANWQSVIASIEETEKRLDIVVNNAGLFRMAFMSDMKLEDFRRLMAINVDGVFLGMKHGGGLIARTVGEGAIVNTSSNAGMVGSPGAVAYCGSKGAVRLMTKAAAKEFPVQGYKIRVNSVHPGYIDTPMGDEVLVSLGGEMERRRKGITRRIPLGRYGEPKDVADVICFLCSDDSRYMSGAELTVDGALIA